jgi:DNA-nicking Smr family endonuclease
MADRRKPRPTVDDADLFDAAMRGVRPIEKGAAAPVEQPAPPPPAKPAAAPPPRPREAAPPTRTRYAPLEPGETGDADRRTLDKLCRGQLRPEARIDLHGMTQQKAHGALTSFIAHAQSDGCRCVLVVTGKGRVTTGGGVLRNALPGWLNALQLRPRIVAFAEAVPRDGGSGAVYVLLRRLRPGGGT